MKRFLVLVLILAAAGMSACASSAVASSSPAPSASPSPAASQSNHKVVDPCSLVTTGEASAAAGRTLVNDVSIGASPIAGACFYGAKGSSTGVYVYMQFYPNSATADAVTVKQLQAVMSGQLGNATSDGQEVGDIGDRAVEFAVKGKAGGGIAIVVYQANVVFMIAMAPSNTATAVERLAKTAAGRLH